MPTVNINVNGQDLSTEVEERQLLVHFLRDDMDLTGTHVGCDTSPVSYTHLTLPTILLV